MEQRTVATPRAPLLSHAGKVVTAIASTGAALVSIVGFMVSYGVIGNSESRHTVGNLGVTWVGLRPTIDTATAIGDTLHLAATITDKNGAVVINARPTWTSDDDKVATVLPDGSVSFKSVYCLGNCALSPALMLDGALYGRVSPERADTSLAGALS